MADKDVRRTSFSEFIDRGFWALTIAVLSYAVSEIRSMSQSVAELNKNVAVIISQNEFQNREIQELRERVQTIERVIHK